MRRGPGRAPAARLPRRSRARWSALLCGALLAACQRAPDEVEHAARAEAADGPWFEERAVAAGLAFVHESGHGARYLMPEIMGGGGALLDADRDGDLDVYLVQGGILPGAVAARAPAGATNRLFANAGDGRFEDVSRGSGADDPGYGMGAACGDHDDDGIEDLFVTNVGRNVLLRGDGAGHFVDVSEAAGVGHPGWGTSAAFVDLDRDGRLDLYVCNYLEWSADTEIPCTAAAGYDYCSPKTYGTPARDLLYLNRDGLSFEDASRASGVHSELGNGLGVACADFDGDGWTDVFVANDGTPDFLWRNRGGGLMENVAFRVGCAADQSGVFKAGMGVAVGDLDDDLDPDLMVCNLDRESDSVFVNADGTFRDRTARLGLAGISKPFTRFGVAWADFDRDGALDLYQANGRVTRHGELHSPDPYAEPNLLFHGVGGRFVEVEPRGGVAPPVLATSRAALVGDLTGDGALDLVVVNRDGPAHLLVNRTRGGNWLLLRVQEASGRHALGAWVTLSFGGRTVRREVLSAYGYLSANDPRVHVGLGRATRAEDVRVHWTDGLSEDFGGLEANAVVVLRRGAGVPAD